MSDFELDAIVNQYFEGYKNGWEQTRILAYYFTSCFSEKTIKPSELMPFEWDKKAVKKLPQPTIDKEKIKKMEEKLNNPNIQWERIS